MLFRYYCIYILIFSILFSSCRRENNFSVSVTNPDATLSHDISLPDWGPYSKKYIGASHIASPEKGIRFDLSLIPAIYNEKTAVPDVFKRTNVYAWEASPNLEYYSFRHQLKWKDQIYADIAYAKIDTQSRLIRMNLVNNTTENTPLSVHLLSSINFPPLQPYQPDVYIEPLAVELPEKAVWIDAIDYLDYRYRHANTRNSLVYNGMLRGEIRENGLVNGSGIEFGKYKGDVVTYRIKGLEKLNNPTLVFRYKSLKDKNSSVKVLFNEKETQNILFEKNSEFSLKTIPLEKNTFSKDLEIILESKDNNLILLDGFALIDSQDSKHLRFYPHQWNPIPEVVYNKENQFILKYENTPTYYGLMWNYPHYDQAEFHSMDLPEDFNTAIHSGKTIFKSDTLSQKHFKDVILQPVTLTAEKNQIIYAAVVSGSLNQVQKKLDSLVGANYEDIYLNARSNLYQYNMVPEGNQYLFSQQRMAATTISNVVYPIYTQNQYIKHHTPGRKWDCLYTWDSGFIGIGLAQIDFQRGLETLNTYLNEPEEQSAFIHHGTPLPVQFYLFQELWNKSQSKTLVEETYPKLKKYYDFLAGKSPGATTRNLNSGLVRTWDYFYNSGGWDDYPPQKYVHENKLTKEVAPVVSTAHLIRAAKILQQAALYLNLKKDFLEYQEDINEMSTALNKYSWDEETGYYGYVTHNKNGNPQGILKYNDSINYNMGLGGLSPIIAGICNQNQQEKIVNNLKTSGKIWSDVGLSTVDQSAPYFNPNGYWNGNVWMPHQWFFWKSMLDIGEGDFAFKIAFTALNVWEKETSTSYNTSEYFKISTKRGSGWYQFSGLSAPVLSWFNAYYEIGNITTGFNTTILDKQFSKENSELVADLWLLETGKHQTSVIVCLNPNFTYKAYWNGKPISVTELHQGTITISIPASNETGRLEVSRL